MLALASILLAFATMVGLFFDQVPGRIQAGTFQRSAASRRAMKLVIMGGLAASLAMAVVAQGWAAGMGQWLAALMVTGVAVVSLAGSYPTLARRLGVLGGAAALSLAIADWTLSG